jgi:hypothetical protein
MKTIFITLTLILVALSSIAQITFEKGYYIDNNNQRIECLIKNNDWKDNPTEFEYKTSSIAETETGTLNSVKEFGVAGFSRYVRADTKIDISSTDIEHLSKDPNPVWSQDVMFLKVLVEGKAMLYYYEKKGLIRYFYSVGDTAINQLIYKEYYDITKKYYVENCEFDVNNKFHAQLFTEVRCPNTPTSVIERLKYRKSDLQKYFIMYNKCISNTAVVYEKKDGKDSFYLKISPGINYSNLSVYNDVMEKYNTDFGSQLNFRLGLEAEYILPFNKKKWGLFFEPTFQYFHAEEQNSSAKVSVNYNSIEFPFGIRYYFFLNQILKLYINALYIPTYSIGINSNFVYQTTISSIEPSTKELKTGQSYAFGGGIAYKKFNAELRYYTNEEIFNNYSSWYSNFRKFSLILGFRIF